MRTIIFTHGDTDGICSGALALAANPDSPIYFTNPVSVLADLDNAEGFDRIIICDIAINLPRAEQIRQKINGLAENAEVIYLDHHPLPKGFSEPWLTSDTRSCGAEMTFLRFRDYLDPDMSRVAMYGAIGDYRDTTETSKEIISNWDKRTLYYQAGTLSQGIEFGRRDYDFKRDLVRLLSENTLPSNIETLAKNAVIASRKEDEMREKVSREVIRMRNLAYVINMNGCISKAAIYARVYGGTPVGLAAEYRDHKDSFDFSVRAKCAADLNILVAKAASKNGGTGGGHPQASGGRVPADSLRSFLLDLDSYIGQFLKGNACEGDIATY